MGTAAAIRAGPNSTGSFRQGLHGKKETNTRWGQIKLSKGAKSSCQTHASHREQRELPVYALLLGKNGPKLTKSAGDSDATPTQGFRKLGEFSAKNETLSDFARFMQLVVLDRPILDKTAIAGRFDIELNWTPDGSQFSNIGIHVPPPTDSPNAPPGCLQLSKSNLV